MLAAKFPADAFDALDFEAVVERFGDRVYRLALSRLRQEQDAEDCYQEVFLRYVRHAGELSSEEHCKAWLLRVTINCCNDMRRSPHYSRRAELSEEVEATLGVEDQAFAALESADAMERALACLTPEEAECVHLFYAEQQTVKAIAELCGASVAAIKVRLYRARKKLKDYWS